MIRPLRRRHQTMIWVIAVLLPIVFVAGIISRKPVPAMKNMPSALAQKAPPMTQVLLEEKNLWGDLNIHTKLFDNAQPMSYLAVELHPQQYLKFPDILVYWADLPAGGMKELPDGAFLLGAVSGTTPHHFVLPDRALENNGVLILYTLARQEIVATAKLPTKNERGTE